MNRPQDILTNLSSKSNQMATTLNMSGFANKDSLLGTDEKSDNVMNRTIGLDNHGLVSLQLQIIKVNKELDLHTRLLDNIDQQVDSTNSNLQKVQKKLAMLNKRIKSGCSCLILQPYAFLAYLIVFFFGH
ncbi:Syntaxin-51-like [Quillaja saponaria]|uniref:Syntaxin-51-like n=1 Tax=Quillaja saponaria TaxID=32244 RepID=A0AAD7VI07_QUISA|nr:Syntaxin-51-like [Quillaja saponaria]